MQAVRKLSFLGYLKSSLNKLSGEKTLSIARLIQMAVKGATRLVEPLYLYASLTGQRDRLLAKSKGLWFYKDYCKLAARFDSLAGLMNGLEGMDREIPDRYHNVYRSYVTLRDGTVTDREFNLLARNKVVKMLKDVGVSNYRVYTDLGLNPGNVNDYLKNGAVEKVSRRTAGAILDYVQGLRKV